MQLFYGVSEDIEKWMCLVRRVRWNFPGLETEEAVILFDSVCLYYFHILTRFSFAKICFPATALKRKGIKQVLGVPFSVIYALRLLPDKGGKVRIGDTGISVCCTGI